MFGYCTATACSSVQIGYATDQVLSSLPSALKRQLQRFNSPFDLPSGTRNGLSNVLVVHVVAAGLTLIMLVLSLVGHAGKAAHAPGFHTGLLVLGSLTTLITLLAFLIDILLFIPNLDWGSYVTLAACALNTGATIALCAGYRRLKTRQAMRARIAENDATFFEEQAQSVPEKVTATLPKFAQFEESPPYKQSTETARTEQEAPGLAVSEPTQRLLYSQSPEQPRANPGYEPVYYDTGDIAMQDLVPREPAQRQREDQRDDYAPRAPYGRAPRTRAVSGPRPMPNGPTYDMQQSWPAEDVNSHGAGPRPPQSPSQLSNSSHFTSVSQRAINPRWQASRGGRGIDMGPQAYEPRRQRRQEGPSLLSGNPDFELTTARKTSRLPKRNMAGW